MHALPYAYAPIYGRFILLPTDARATATPRCCLLLSATHIRRIHAIQRRAYEGYAELCFHRICHMPHVVVNILLLFTIAAAVIRQPPHCHAATAARHCYVYAICHASLPLLRHSAPATLPLLFMKKDIIIVLCWHMSHIWALLLYIVALRCRLLFTLCDIYTPLLLHGCRRRYALALPLLMKYTFMRRYSSGYTPCLRYAVGCCWACHMKYALYG